MSITFLHILHISKRIGCLNHLSSLSISNCVCHGVRNDLSSFTQITTVISIDNSLVFISHIVFYRLLNLHVRLSVNKSSIHSMSASMIFTRILTDHSNSLVFLLCFSNLCCVRGLSTECIWVWMCSNLWFQRSLPHPPYWRHHFLQQQLSAWPQSSHLLLTHQCIKL
ncbi:hypothetical protein O6H91_14G059600 [Diphasiastrum complanatum]|uniref:Uncharacterized protein n=1 Tax=Diphasiastrum complanatum TaxID=34168 RepID=A0ACC2BPZ9_DIPCM|nr:hypothetical protein O6H91_14G059600 [Diphasiastrum complanatum]